MGPESTPAPGVFSPGRDNSRLSEYILSLGRKHSKEHTCFTKPFSPGQNAITWANYAENNDLSDELCNYYHFRAIRHDSDD